MPRSSLHGVPLLARAPGLRAAERETRRGARLRGAGARDRRGLHRRVVYSA